MNNNYFEHVILLS